MKPDDVTIRPDEVASALRAATWPKSGLARWLICPLCCALIPRGVLANGKTTREHHTDYHADQEARP